MTNKEILKEVMKKYYFNPKEIIIVECDYGFRVDVYYLKVDYPSVSLPYECIIFTHKFAKAFFSCEHKCKPYKSGSYFDECEKCNEICPIGSKWYTWKDHLKNMVVLEEPLKYLEKYL